MVMAQAARQDPIVLLYKPRSTSTWILLKAVIPPTQSGAAGYYRRKFDTHSVDIHDTGPCRGVQLEHMWIPDLSA